MPVVAGNGRCGTNIALEILSGSKELQPSDPPENKKFFVHRRPVKPNYLTKTDTAYFEVEDIQAFLAKNKDFPIVWMIRDPRDMCMSKLRRGAPDRMGGDCSVWADDGSPEGCLRDMQKMFEIYQSVKDAPSVKLFHMENFLIDVERASRTLCDHCRISFEKDMTRFWERMRNPNKRRRYQGLDRSQLSLWTHWKTAYDGWLCRYDMDSLFKDVYPMTKEFGYAK